MKRFSNLFIVFMISLLAACGNNEQENTAGKGEESGQQKEEQKDEGAVDVEKGLLMLKLHYLLPCLKVKTLTLL